MQHFTTPCFNSMSNTVSTKSTTSPCLAEVSLHCLEKVPQTSVVKWVDTRPPVHVHDIPVLLEEGHAIRLLHRVPKQISGSAYGHRRAARGGSRLVSRARGGFALGALRPSSSGSPHKLCPPIKTPSAALLSAHSSLPPPPHPEVPSSHTFTHINAHARTHTVLKLFLTQLTLRRSHYAHAHTLRARALKVPSSLRPALFTTARCKTITCCCCYLQAVCWLYKYSIFNKTILWKSISTTGMTFKKKKLLKNGLTSHNNNLVRIQN